MAVADVVRGAADYLIWQHEQVPPPPPDPEWARCAADRAYFIRTAVQIYDSATEGWIPFTLWPAQEQVLGVLATERLTVILKARQLGQTYLALAFILHAMIFTPAQSVLLFSRRQEESWALLERLKSMAARLPPGLRPPVARDSAATWELSNGSVARAFPLTAGDSYTATLAFLDEADLPDDSEQRALMEAVKPTIEKGRMILLSKVDKRKPDSLFKRIYRAAKAGTTGWAAVFLPWWSRPDRTPAWYAAERADTLATTGAEDDLWANYPATDAEALAPRALDKRLPAAWLLPCYVEEAPLPPALWPVGLGTLPGLRVYRLPVYGRRYVGGADPATGAGPRSDESAVVIGDALSGEEVASWTGVAEPTVFAATVAALARVYAGAGVLVERNNRAFGVLDWLAEHAPDVPLLPGDDGKVGWLSSSTGKVRLYDTLADSLRTQDATVHTERIKDQLASIERATLLAPPGAHDDEADAYALMHAARRAPPPDSAAVQWGRYSIGRSS